MIKTIYLTVGNSPYKLEAVTTIAGDDIFVVVVGGSKYHVGAVAAAYVEKSVNVNQELSTTVSSISIPNHKENEIVQKAALDLSKQLNCSVVVTAGLHIDEASQNDIQELVKNFYLLIEQIKMMLNQQNNNR